MDPMNIDETVQAESPHVVGLQATNDGMIYLTKSIGAMAHAVVDRLWRDPRSGVHVEALRGGGVRLTANDGRMCLICEEERPISPNDFPEIPGLADAPNCATKAIIPADACLALGKALGKRRRGAHPCEAVAAVRLSDTAITIGTCTDGSASLQTVRPVGGEFPDTEGKIPRGTPRISVSFSVEVLSKLLKACEGLLPEKGRVLRFDIFDDPRQRIDGAPNALAVRVVGVTAGGMPLVGAVMPVTLDAMELSRSGAAGPRADRFGDFPDAGQRARDRRRRQEERREADSTKAAAETAPQQPDGCQPAPSDMQP